jgi:hypothetical protein
MKRRTAIKITALGALAPRLDALGLGLGHALTNPGCSESNLKLLFFTTKEKEFLDQLMEMIIPADHHSAGAQAADVSLFADLMVSTSGMEIQKHWREGLKQMQDEARKSSLAKALAKSAAHENHPTTELERFFRSLKHMTVNGYYTSAIGIHQDLQYQGNTYLNAFPGCALHQLARDLGPERAGKTQHAAQFRAPRNLAEEPRKQNK